VVPLAFCLLLFRLLLVVVVPLAFCLLLLLLLLFRLLLLENLVVGLVVDLDFLF
jgi:hypothetical protein